eukprot:1150277-Rhodomonas_salina.1
MPGTDMPGTDAPVLSLSSHPVLPPCTPKSNTESAFLIKLDGDCFFLQLIQCSILRPRYAMPGTDVGYDATRYHAAARAVQALRYWRAVCCYELSGSYTG